MEILKKLKSWNNQVQIERIVESKARKKINSGAHFKFFRENFLKRHCWKRWRKIKKKMYNSLLNDILVGIKQLQTGQEEMKKDVQQLQTGQEEMKKDIQQLQINVQQLQTGQEEMKKNIQQLQTGQEEMKKDIQQLQNHQTQAMGMSVIFDLSKKSWFSKTE